MGNYPSPEQRVPGERPVRRVRTAMDMVVKEMSPRSATLHAELGRQSLAPERVLRAPQLQPRYAVGSERYLMERLDYGLLFQRTVGL